MARLKPGLKVNRLRLELRLQPPKSESYDQSETVSWIQANDRTEATACLTVLQHVRQSKDLDLRAESKPTQTVCSPLEALGMGRLQVRKAAAVVCHSPQPTHTHLAANYLKFPCI